MTTRRTTFGEEARAGIDRLARRAAGPVWTALGCGALALATTACGGGAPAPVYRPDGTPAPPRVLVGSLDARLLLADLPARAVRLGASPAAILSAGEQMEGERFGGFFSAPADACILAYARGSTSIDDIDIVAFAEEGNPIASDQAPDSHPTILLCPPHPERVYIAAHVAGGEGLVAIAAHVVPAARAAEVGRIFGARGARGEGTRPAEAWPGLEDRVRRHRAAVGGTWEDFRRVAVRVDARAPTTVALPLEANQCVDVVVVPDDDVALLEVEAVDEAGRVVARARDGSRDPAFVVCSPLAFDGALSIRPHVGAGLAAVVLGRARGEAARDLTGRTSVAWTASPMPLDAAKAKRNGELSKSGYGAPTSAVQGQLMLGRRIPHPIAVPGGAAGCGRVDVVGGTPLALVEAAIWDGQGTMLANGEGTNAVTLFVCGRDKAQLELEVRGRPGPYAVLTRPEKWQSPAFARLPVASSRMLARAAVGESMLFEGTPGAVKTFPLDASKRGTYTVNVAAGSCLRVAAGIEGEGAGVELRLFDANSSDELDRAAGARGSAARACAPANVARPVRVEVRGVSGKVEAVVGERFYAGTPPS